MYGFAGVASFTTFCWIISFYVDQFGDQVKKFHPGDPIQIINKWRDIHVTIIETVSLIQDCFGLFLLIWITFAVINLIINAFFLSDLVFRSNFEMESAWEYAVFMIRSLFNLFMLTASPVILNRKVRKQ